MNFHVKHASHLPAVIDALRHTEGDVLELGTGFGSTFPLHWMCLHMGRKLVSCENNARWLRAVRHCRSSWHDIWFVEDWDETHIERPWGVALVDHGPAERRKVEVLRLRAWAQVIVVHDAERGLAHHYDYDGLLDSFKWRRDYVLQKRVTAVLSDHVDVTRWADGLAD